MITIPAYFHSQNETMYDLGKNNGLKGKALDYFSYFNEIGVDLEVDEKTGEVKKVTLKQ